MNRSTIYEFLRNDTDLMLRYRKIGKGNYPVLVAPYKWETPILMVNNWRITDFQAVMLFSNEFVVRFGTTIDAQINIPYKDIDYIEVHEDMDIGYMKLYHGDKVEDR